MYERNSNLFIGEIQVLTAVSMKMAVFWDVAQFSLVDTVISEDLTASIIRVFMIRALMVEALRTSKMSVYFKETTPLHPRRLPSSSP
jgi:hypothetical protein